jgi:ubiquinone/menaquinone biosynthesis C-methylase UbiE
VASHFHIDEGSTVIDMGAGAGAYVSTLARKVGPRGRVIACEVQRPLVEKIGALARFEQLSPVEPVWCDIEAPGSTRLPNESSDFVVIINTLHQIEARDQAVAEVYRTLRTGGIVYVVDWIDSFGGIGPHDKYVVSKEAAINLFESSLFIYEREYPAGTYHYGLAFRKL